ncbi:hypothetical protein CSA08_01690 [Candidatus Gracilibacteria bacterium]|nr:MAG: hypothetical protein CSA08_01690 [Candidatus Gracilibacteria bacterium]
MLDKSFNNLVSYLKFLRVFSDYEITDYYISEKITEPLELEDIAKSVGRFLSNYRLEGSLEKISKLKKLFYDLGYIWRGNNFFKFRTPIENMLVYSKSKLNGVKNILNLEYKNLGEDLKVAIITDFLEEKDEILTCKYLLKNLKEYKNLNPILISGQGTWKYDNFGNIIKIEKNIIEVTSLLESGETKLLIGTRGILGEGWDCPKLNTLIDLTGIVAYMSVNQVRGRPIRLDKTNNKKLANIYDIITVFDGYNKAVDYSRLKRKHQKVYGIDDSGVVVKGVDHIIPNLKEKILDIESINSEMMQRAINRDKYYDLWDIGKKYDNKEVYGLNLSLLKSNSIFLTPNNYNFKQTKDLLKILKNFELNKDLYYENIYKFISFLLVVVVKTMINIGFIPEDFQYTLTKGKDGNFKLISNYKDDLIIKKFMSEVSLFFSVIINQRYVLEMNFGTLENKKINLGLLKFGLPDSVSRTIKHRKIFKKELSKIKLKITGKMLLSYNIFTNFESYRNLIKFGKIINNKNKNYKLSYIKSSRINKKDYIGKRPIIISKIEKIWL